MTTSKLLPSTDADHEATLEVLSNRVMGVAVANIALMGRSTMVEPATFDAALRAACAGR